ncbi:MAG: 1-(5-phosphoribosyl)-5-[(5-phosphoribosylamino)methylideneamino]imidazole-4-carboxamide isomerase [Thermomicrobiales bacterium]|nr:1-(5-phosphoribosyl)-5-[(5-phosphoribosylamino)methylideneamino]imidazole-4-carboxamide isomerase [Thermomicrobiales bacterium]
MIVYPAIDVRGGRCVRLVEGDFARETAYDADPADAARRWSKAGAEWLHVVDLDGAVIGEPVNTDAIRRIRHAVDTPIQLGGGLRLPEHLEAAFEMGIDRVILGTVALSDPELVKAAVQDYGDRIAVALDARDGRLAAAGWLEQTDAVATEVAQRLRAAAIAWFIATDIARDGTLSGPNLASLRGLQALLGSGVIASGGIGSIADVRAVADLGVAGVIVGRALYDGRVDLAEAIAVGKNGAYA